MATKTINIVAANRDNVSKYGEFIGPDLSPRRKGVPFYSHVDGGSDLPFEYGDGAVIRVSRIHPIPDKLAPIVWLERHMSLTQFFIGLDQSKFHVVLSDADAFQSDDIDQLECFSFEAGTGIILKKGIWHEFPMALDGPSTLIVGNSNETVVALGAISVPREMDEGDVQKIHINQRFGRSVFVSQWRD